MLRDYKDAVKFSATEQKIIDSRLDGLSFNQHTLDEQKSFASELILAVAAFTGCNLPNTNTYTDIVTALIYDFILNFGFSHLTFSEILLSLKLNTTGQLDETTQLNQPNFNIMFLSKVLKSYNGLRYQIDRKIQNFLD